MIEDYLLELPSGLKLTFIASEQVEKLIPSENSDDFHKFATVCRINALSAIKAAGSGHIGTSFSVIDLLVSIRVFLFKDKIGKSDSKNILFSSKGHDAPGIYSVMNLFKEIPDKKLHELRRLDGLPGHPEVGVFGIPASTGSLGMGISKAKGFSYSKKFSNDPGYVVVILGDGELQEGQIWESLPGAARDELEKLVVVVDGNKIQSDTWVDQTLPLGNLRMRVEGCSWKFHEMDGHDFQSMKETFARIESSPGPHFIYAHTIKGFGVSFFSKFPLDGKFYKYHSGAPSDIEYELAIAELKSDLLSEIYDGEVFSPDHFNPKSRNRLFIQIWSELLTKWGQNTQDLFVLDADLSYDTGTYEFREKFPERYIQCGIAEQDMVSVAGGLALSNRLPVVHSFSSFLTTRPAEQIFNNLSESTCVIYVGFLAGILPSAPGHSHQAVADIGIMNSYSAFKIIEPSCEAELKVIFEKSILGTNEAIYLRLGSTELPAPFIDRVGNLFLRRHGLEKLILTSGPAMTNIALEVASKSKFDVAVVTRPELSDDFDLKEIQYLNKFSEILILENFLPTLAHYEKLQHHIGHLPSTRLFRSGINEIPRNGWTEEVLNYHGLSSDSLLLKYGW